MFQDNISGIQESCAAFKKAFASGVQKVFLTEGAGEHPATTAVINLLSAEPAFHKRKAVYDGGVLALGMLSHTG